jgi:hypothetical protein
VLIYTLQAFTAVSFAYAPEVPEQDAVTASVTQKMP